MSFDWEDTAIRLLEMNLNGETLNHDGLKELFAAGPHILEDLDISSDGAAVEDLDRALYGGRPNVIEIRELKPTQIHHCKACNRSFKRADNFRRHLVTSLHLRRQKRFELAAQIQHEEKLDAKGDSPDK
jgi:tRNA U54 and U55 pseudouridine synthase Pus10